MHLSSTKQLDAGLSKTSQVATRVPEDPLVNGITTHKKPPLAASPTPVEKAPTEFAVRSRSQYLTPPARHTTLLELGKQFMLFLYLSPVVCD